MLFIRVDNRLVHGQVIEAWLPYTGAKHLVVANDALAADMLRQQIISLAIPQRICIHFISLQQLAPLLRSIAHEKVFILIEHCQDAAAIFALDISLKQLNVGNLHFTQGKQQLLPHIAVTKDELSVLQSLSQKIALDFRSVPTEKNRELHELLQ